jgi:hypothetical protein
MKRSTRALGLCACLAVVALAGPPNGAASDGIGFVNAPKSVLRGCIATARLVGYPVPCPLSLPRGLTPDSGGGGCAGGLVFTPFRSVATCSGARGWRGWVAGAGSAPGIALSLTAAPQLEPSIAKLVNGPAWYPAARVTRLGRARVGDRLVQWAFVPAATNDGSQFSDAVAAVWSSRGHSYAVGVRAAGGRVAERALLVRLLEGLTLVKPPG